MIPQSYVRFDPALSLNMRLPGTIRRALPPLGADAPPEPAPVLRSIAHLAVRVMLDGLSREIVAYLSPIPRPILIYGPSDFAAACADSMDDHCERILELLGADPTSSLQSMINGTDLPAPPPRIPREVELWQAKSIMDSMGLIPQVEAAIAAMPDAASTVVTCAWSGNARLTRRGPTVAALAPALGLTAEQLDAMFVQAAALVV